MLPVLRRLSRTLFAAILGGAEALALIVIGLIIGVVLLRTGLEWYATGRFDLVPPATMGMAKASRVAVLNATPEEAAALKTAIASLRYRLAPTAVTFDVTNDRGVMGYEGEYIPTLHLIRIQKSAFSNSIELRHTVAHEVGHYVDEEYLTETRRRRYMELRHIPSNLTWLAPALPWQRRPVEDFAEVFSLLNLPTLGVPAQTSYGPVRHPAVFMRFLASAGVSFDRSTQRVDWRSAIGQEYQYFLDTTAGTANRLVIELCVIILVGYFALSDGLDTWQRTAPLTDMPAPAPPMRESRPSPGPRPQRPRRTP